MAGEQHNLLIVDDDEAFRERLAKAFEQKGYRVVKADCAAAAIGCLEAEEFDFAVVDLKMPGQSGQQVVREIRERSLRTRTVILTGYGSISSAVEAMRSGAVDYLTKPANADEIEARLLGVVGSKKPDADEVPSLERVEWEHLQRVLHDCRGNISAAARRLGIERRTLQRKLQKYPPRK